MKNLAIIPARGGSKRIPRKNIKNFLGKPIIAYSIEIALKSGLFDEVMVSTDDTEIAKIAKKYGAKVPFLRSEANSNDFATTADVLIEVLENYNFKYPYACCIYPTAPLVSVNSIIEAHEKLIANNYDSVFPIVRFGYPIQRSLKVVKGKVSIVYPEHTNSRSQDLEPRYHDSGQFYWFKSDVVVNEKKIITNNTSYIELNELAVQDIDNETDWQIAEIKYKLLYGKA